MTPELEARMADDSAGGSAGSDADGVEVPGASVASPDGRDSRWSRHRSGRRDEVLSAAVALIDRDGAGVSVAAISAASETPRSVIYRLFDGREDLDEHIRRRIVDDLMATLVPAVSIRGSLRTSTQTAVETYVGWVAAHPQLNQFLGLAAPSAPGGPPRSMADAKVAIAADLANLISSVLPASPLDAATRNTALDLAFALVGAVDNVVNHWAARGSDEGDVGRLVSYLTESCCALIEATAGYLGFTIDLDAELRG